MRRLRMRLGAIKNICHGFTLRGRQRRHVHERPYPVIVRAGDHRARIRMSRQHHRPTGSFNHAFESGDVLRKRCERNRRAGYLEASFRNGRITFCQQEPSAHAPWTNTIVAF